jgi:DNA polymerase alpha subunit B
MEEEIRKEFQSNGFSIGGAGPEDAAQILSTRKYKRPHRLFPF